ncbi:MAG: hypothetical protein M3Z83_02035, partial [Actinomycetota bacterium]|nr:hypothetical protein [Actinomycetota bacterium]
MSWRAALALAAVLLVAALVFTVRVARAEQTAAPSAVSGSTPAAVVSRQMPSAFATSTSTPPSGASGVAAAPSPAGTGSAPPAVVIHVVGQVAHPGV